MRKRVIVRARRLCVRIALQCWDASERFVFLQKISGRVALFHLNTPTTCHMHFGIYTPPASVLLVARDHLKHSRLQVRPVKHARAARVRALEDGLGLLPKRRRPALGGFQELLGCFVRLSFSGNFEACSGVFQECLGCFKLCSRSVKGILGVQRDREGLA